jgi:hypothetical protein
VLAGGLAARAGEVTVVGANLFRLLYQLPDAVGQPLVAAVQLGSLAVVPVAVGLALACRRLRLAGALAVAGGVAWALAGVVQDLVGRAGPAELLGSVVERIGAAIGTALLVSVFYRILTSSGHAYSKAVSDALLCACTLMLLALLLAIGELWHRRHDRRDQPTPTPQPQHHHLHLG